MLKPNISQSTNTNKLKNVFIINFVTKLAQNRTYKYNWCGNQTKKTLLSKKCIDFNKEINNS